MTRRNIELILLLVASPLVILMFAMLAINEGQALNMQTLGVPVGIFGAFIVAHIATRILAPEADPAILPISFALSGIGIAFITRVAPFSDSPNMAINQVVWLFLGVAHDRGHGVFAQPRPARQLQVHARHRRRHSFALADDPRHRPGNLRQPHLAACRRILLPTRRDREDHYRALPGRLPCAEPRDALGVHLAYRPVPPARHPHASAAAPHVGRGNAHRRVREGSRQRARVLPRVSGHALHCHGKEVLPGNWLRPRCHRRRGRLLRLRSRADARRHLA